MSQQKMYILLLYSMVKPTLTTSQQTVKQIESTQVVVLTKVSKISESVMNKKRDSLQFFPKK